MITLLYLLAGALFIVGLRGLGSPRTARRGNQIAATAVLGALGSGERVFAPSPTADAWHRVTVAMTSPTPDERPRVDEVLEFWE